MRFEPELPALVYRGDKPYPCVVSGLLMDYVSIRMDAANFRLAGGNVPDDKKSVLIPTSAGAVELIDPPETITGTITYLDRDVSLWSKVHGKPGRWVTEHKTIKTTDIHWRNYLPEWQKHAT